MAGRRSGIGKWRKAQVALTMWRQGLPPYEIARSAKDDDMRPVFRGEGEVVRCINEALEKGFGVDSISTSGRDLMVAQVDELIADLWGRHAIVSVRERTVKSLVFGEQRDEQGNAVQVPVGQMTEKSVVGYEGVFSAEEDESSRTQRMVQRMEAAARSARPLVELIKLKATLTLMVPGESGSPAPGLPALPGGPASNPSALPSDAYKDWDNEDLAITAEIVGEEPL